MPETSQFVIISRNITGFRELRSPLVVSSAKRHRPTIERVFRMSAYCVLDLTRAGKLFSSFIFIYLILSLPPDCGSLVAHCHFGPLSLFLQPSGRLNKFMHAHHDDRRAAMVACTTAFNRSSAKQAIALSAKTNESE